MSKVVEKIISENIPCYFISPHLDDAMLSSGALITYLSDKVPVTVITVFTEASEGLHTLSAMQFLKQCGYTSATALFADRRAEDVRASKLAGVSYKHLGYVDALFRKREGLLANTLGKYIPEFSHVNPTYRFHIVRGSVSAADKQLTREITETVRRMLPQNREYAIFGPMAQGNHLDHRITRDVCKALTSESFSWLDYPYCIREESSVKEEPRFAWNGDLQKKTEIIQCYSSQVKAMFGTKPIQLVEEVYY